MNSLKGPQDYRFVSLDTKLSLVTQDLK